MPGATVAYFGCDVTRTQLIRPKRCQIVAFPKTREPTFTLDRSLRTDNDP